MKPLVILALLLSLNSTVVFGQIKIGDNPQNIDASSVLELESTNKVLVITRVTNLEMESIVPLRGAVLYNTDTQCLHYFNGTEWINLCDAVSFSLTNDPIVNTRSTISITDNGGTINLEVAPNSIRSENIVDGGINGDDIQDNSIGESKLGSDSVSANELRDNSVGSTEIVDGTIRPVDIANAVPNQILITDINGIVAWDDAVNLQGAVADEVTITGSGTLTAPLALTEAVTTSISDNSDAIIAENTRAIAAEQANANDITNLQTDKEDVSNKDPNTNLGTSDDAYPTQNAVKTYVDAQVGGVSTDDDITGVSFDGTNLTVDEGTTTFSADLSALEESNEIATLQLDVDNNEAAVDAALILKEDIVNKDGNVLLGNSNDAYPTQNAVKVYVDTEIADIVTSGGSDPINETNTDFAVIAGNLVLTDISGTFTVPLTDIDTNTQLTDAEIGDFGYIKTDLDEQNLAQVLAQGNNAGAPIIGLNISLDPTSAATRGYVDANLGGNQDLAGVLGNGTSAGNNQINDLLDPTLPQDAATKKYVDDSVVAAGGGVPDDELNQTFEVNGLNLELTDAAGTLQVPLANINTDDQNLESAILTGSDLAINIEGGNNVIADLAALTTDAELLVAITASDTADGDTSNTNELQNITSTDNSVTITPSATGNDFDLSVAGGGTDDQNLESAILTGSDLAINIEGGNNVIADLAALTTDAELLASITASDTADGDTSDTNELQNITSTDNSVTITASATGNDFDLSVAMGGTDDQNLESAILTGSDLAINIEGGNNVIADLAALTTDAELLAAITASETADGDTSDTNEIQPVISSDGSVGITANGIGFDLSVAGGGTDDQNLESAILTGSNLEINIEGGNNVTADLAALATDAELLAAITASETADGDTSDTNEIQTISSPDASVTVTSIGNNYELAVTNGQNITNADLNLDADRTVGLAGNNLRFSGTGSVRIGSSTTVNSNKLHVEGTIRAEGIRNTFGTLPGSVAYSFNDDSNTGMYRAAADQLGFVTGGAEAIRITANGNVGIGEANPARNLHVGGEVQFDDDVYLGGAAVPEHVPDYVFQKYFNGFSNLDNSYKFQSLDELESFIKTNHHLPGIKSAAQVKEEGVWNLSKSNIKNLEKIEELFLHTIEQEKKIKELKSSNTKMAKEVELLKAQMEEIKKMVLAKDKI